MFFKFRYTKQDTNFNNKIVTEKLTTLNHITNNLSLNVLLQFLISYPDKHREKPNDLLKVHIKKPPRGSGRPN